MVQPTNPTPQIPQGGGDGQFYQTIPRAPSAVNDAIYHMNNVLAAMHPVDKEKVVELLNSIANGIKAIGGDLPNVIQNLAASLGTEAKQLENGSSVNVQSITASLNDLDAQFEAYYDN